MSITRKLKICKTCGDPSYLWSNGNCKRCDGLARAKEQSFKPYKPLTQTTNGKVAKAFKISPVSLKRAQELKLYRVERDKYFVEHPVCEFEGCTSRKVELHHKKGRIGKLLTDSRYFCSLCNKHHRWVTNNNAAALEMGLVESRLATAI